MTSRPCPHTPACPSSDAPDHDAARILSPHPEQGWTLLCNGVVVFDDTGELLPDGGVVLPHRPGCRNSEPRWSDAASVAV
jgi:hypothetical protein